MSEFVKSLTSNLTEVKTFVYYIIVAVGGGIIKELNTVHGEPQNLRQIFARGFTGVWVAIIFGLGTEALTNNVKLSIAITALAGVSGFEALQWLTKLVKERVEQNAPKKAEETVDQTERKQ